MRIVPHNHAIRCIVAALLLLAAARGDRPNIVLIMTDDQGYGDFGATGNPVIHTPHLDALARGSATMSRFYVSPVCSPTRASLMTGRYNYRTRVVDTWVGRSMMEPDEVTIAETLRDAGYATGIFGKWHLGDCYPMRPSDQGFDESLVHRGGGLAQPSEPLENKGRYTDAILYRNNKRVLTKGYCTDVYFDAAMRFIRERKQAGRPFFAYIATNAPHGPFHDVPDELYRKYKATDLSPVAKGGRKHHDKLARIFAMIENVDQNVGRLVAELDRLGIADQTVVVFMVDNGPNTTRYVGPFRGQKTHVHEGGIRSPLWVRWPARLKPGTASDRVAAHIDIMPTLLEAAGATPPKGVKLDGRSVLPLLEGRDVEWPDRTIVIQAHRGDAPHPAQHVAVIGQRYKLVHPTGFAGGDPHAAGETPWELYDIANDPGEANNLHPHPESAKLLEFYDTWFKDVSSARPDNYAPPRIVLGTEHERVTTLTRQDARRHPNDTGWGTRCTWKARIDRPAVFNATVVLHKPIAGRVTLKLGPRSKTLEFAKPTARIVFEQFAAAPGDVDVYCAVFDAAGRPVAPHSVVVKLVAALP